MPAMPPIDLPTEPTTIEPLTAPGPRAVLAVRPKTVAAVLAFLALALTLANPLVKLAEAHLDLSRHHGLREVLWRFDFDRSNCIEIWYSSAILLVAAMLLVVIAAAERQDGRRQAFHWAVLAAGFLYLSLDESLKLHKVLLVSTCRRLLGWLFPCDFWVVPGVLLVLVLAVSYWKLLVGLNSRLRRLFVASAAVYLGGALGMDTLSGICSRSYGMLSAAYVAATTLEEGLEMAGAVLFLYSLLVYMGQQFDSWQFRVQGTTER